MFSFLLFCQSLRSAVVLSLAGWLGEVRVDVWRQWTILKTIGGQIVLRQGIHFHLIRLGLQVVVEGSVLSSRLALIEVVNFFEAHARRHFFFLNALSHPLHEGVARMRLHVH